MSSAIGLYIRIADIRMQLTGATYAPALGPTRTSPEPLSSSIFSPCGWVPPTYNARRLNDCWGSCVVCRTDRLLVLDAQQPPE
jgi:hypothetical protein